MFAQPIKFILNLIFPINCLNCGKEGDWLCLVCFNQIALKPEKIKPVPPLNRLFVACDYQNSLVKNMVLNLKYNFIRDLVDPIGQLMSRRLAQCHSKNESAFLIPVPLHKKRLRWRGFNQAELLANKIGQESDIPVIDDALIRRRHALPQAKIENALQRKENIKNSFAINPDFKKDISGKTIILIDDIATTGATLAECARALKPLQPKQIWALVFARG